MSADAPPPPSDDRIDRYDYPLPEELVATHPSPERTASRLLVLDRTTDLLAHSRFSSLPEFLRPGDALIFNRTRVIPAKLRGVRVATGGKWEGLFLGQKPDGTWRLIGQTRGKLRPGETIALASYHHPAADPFELTLLDRRANGEWTARPREPRHDALAVLAQYGTVPLPPYIHRDAAEQGDFERYQTVYATEPGAVAAPTAGLHFDEPLIARLREAGVTIGYVTLHVGIGTFRPVTAQRLDEHEMHAEWCDLPEDTVRLIEQTRRRGGRVIPVGTTAVRTLESAAARGPLAPFRGETNLFIRPGFRFQCTDALITNFHLPKSTLLVLVSALAGRERILTAYAEAISRRYRFFSYGDAMLIL